MQSERSTTEPHPLLPETPPVIYYYHCRSLCEVITHITKCWLHVVIAMSGSIPDMFYHHCHNPYKVIRHISQCWLHVYIFIF